MTRIIVIFLQIFSDWDPQTQVSSPFFNIENISFPLKEGYAELTEKCCARSVDFLWS